MCDKYHQNVVQRIQFISLKTHRESLILILCYLGTWLQLNQTYSAVKYQHWVTSCVIWDAEKRWPVGSGQWRSLKQVIKGAMKDEEVNKGTKKKFKRNKTPNSVVSSVLLLLLLFPWYLPLLSVSLWASQKLFQFGQLNDAEYGLSLFVFVIKLHWILRYTHSSFYWLVGVLKFVFTNTGEKRSGRRK